MDHVLPEERESLLRRCIESTEMRQLRSRWGKYPAISAMAVAALVAISSDMLLHQSAPITVSAVLVGGVVSFIAVIVLKLVVEYRLIRQLLRDELHKNGA